MRKTKIHIRRTNLRGEDRWELTVPQEYKGRSRRYFETRQEAETAMAQAKIELRNHGTAMLSFPDQLRSEATKADAALSRFGKTLSDAVTFYLAHLEQTATSRPVAEVLRDLLKAREGDGVSRRYHKDLRNRLSRFVDSFGTRLIAEVAVSEIESWLRSLCVGDLTRNSYRLRLSTLFEFACAQGWCAENPVVAVIKAKVHSGKIGILKREELARLLERSGEDTLPYWAIGAFAGLRSAELERLEWQDVHFDSGLIEVTAIRRQERKRLPHRSTQTAGSGPRPRWISQVAQQRATAFFRLVSSRAFLRCSQARSGNGTPGPKVDLRQLSGAG